MGNICAFHFDGNIPASKSILNRLIIAQAYKPSLQILGDSQCDDVQLMRKATIDLFSKNEAHCGSAGTVLRFLAFLASRQEGVYKLTGTERLLSRPKKEFEDVLQQLGVNCISEKDYLLINSQGWQWDESKPIKVDRSRSSQFITGLLLNSWNLSKDIQFNWEGDVASDAYFLMTLNILKDLGMSFDLQSNSIKVFKNQEVTANQYRAESDMSSSFAIAAIAALGGRAQLLNFPMNSLQPDGDFKQVLQKMNVKLKHSKDSLIVKRNVEMLPIEIDLNNTPDLFPVLAILCSMVPGTSKLYGAKHLKYKESDRLEKIKELLSKMGKSFTEIEGGLEIHGDLNKSANFDYSTDHDHRLAFAAALAMEVGFKIQLDDPGVVSKSFPEFWTLLKQRQILWSA